MKIVPLEALKPGDKLARPLFSTSGQFLLHQETILTNQLLDRLMKYEIEHAYITKDISINLDSKTFIEKDHKNKVVQYIRESFHTIYNHPINGNTFIVEQAAEGLKQVVGDMNKLVKQNNDIVSLLSDVFVFDDSIFTHSLNVTIYTLTIARELPFTKQELEELGLGALLHDIGKLKIPKEILLKPDRLSKEEYEIVKHHTVYGYDMIKLIPNIPQSVLRCVKEHHERLNGTGYPEGLSSDKLHIFSKIIGVADTFDAMTTERVYQDKRLPHEALEILYTGSGTLFEQKYIELFRQNVAVYPNGMKIVLNDGRKGIVIKQNNEVSDRPILTILEEQGKAVKETYEIDLSKHLNLVVQKIYNE
ncbi:putative nucleotidyltransferase with HDIG domain [Salirhabdus euzebyi]|uniref:Putative nucleotidyltransferase with HDIG domain n=1 Tax=Salirhabdus euzebyi TaxID=394506 RepID=A0A841Q520_9BACI|nr:HD-GYP domain-containing protein [Salirhabdus euzebyi]MBB6453453.1 putative nucleotidyltransferase with HDIG domain [Salirhabdus euzebyi]